jgi:LacI family transcriptional regulator
VLSGFSNPFFPSLIEESVSVAGESGYSVFVAASDDPEAEVLRLAATKSVDGVILVHSTLDDSVDTNLNDLDIPVVAFDRAPRALDSLLVQGDNHAGACEVVRHLREMGCERIAHIAGPAGMDVAEERKAGYVDALREQGLPVTDSRIVAGDFSERSGAAALSRLLENGTRPDAVFAANDLMAIGAMSAARAAGVRVPHELAIAGFDGINVGRYVVPSLTTYVQPVHDIAQVCVTSLIKEIERGGDRSARRRQVVKLSGHLEVRQSTLRNERGM